MHLQFFIFIGFIPWLAAGKYTSNKNNTSIFFSSLMHNDTKNGRLISTAKRGKKIMTTAVKLKQVHYIERYFGLKNKPSTGAKTEISGNIIHLF